MKWTLQHFVKIVPFQETSSERQLMLWKIFLLCHSLPLNTEQLQCQIWVFLYDLIWREYCQHSDITGECEHRTPRVTEVCWMWFLAKLLLSSQDTGMNHDWCAGISFRFPHWSGWTLMVHVDGHSCQTLHFSLKSMQLRLNGKQKDKKSLSKSGQRKAGQMQPLDCYVYCSIKVNGDFTELRLTCIPNAGKQHLSTWT